MTFWLFSLAIIKPGIILVLISLFHEEFKSFNDLDSFKFRACLLESTLYPDKISDLSLCDLM
jgi:hypothetical protein